MLMRYLHLHEKLQAAAGLAAHLRAPMPGAAVRLVAAMMASLPTKLVC